MHTVWLFAASAVFGLALVIGLRTGQVHTVYRGMPTVVFTRKDDARGYRTAIASYALGSGSCFGMAIGIVPSISETLGWSMHYRGLPFPH
jgi:hypothetical protein